MDTIITFLKPFAEIISAKVPALGAYSANAIAVLMAVGLLIELVELAATFTASKADDEAAAKIMAIKDKVLSVLEVIPHANIPVAAAITKITAILTKVLKIGKAATDAAK